MQKILKWVRPLPTKRIKGRERGFDPTTPKTVAYALSFRFHLAIGGNDCVRLIKRKSGEWCTAIFLLLCFLDLLKVGVFEFPALMVKRKNKPPSLGRFKINL
jgi:hypothetical protein